MKQDFSIPLERVPVRFVVNFFGLLIICGLKIILLVMSIKNKVQVSISIANFYLLFMPIHWLVVRCLSCVGQKNHCVVYNIILLIQKSHLFFVEILFLESKLELISGWRCSTCHSFTTKYGCKCTHDLAYCPECLSRSNPLPKSLLCAWPSCCNDTTGNLSWSCYNIPLVEQHCFYFSMSTCN